MITMNDKTCSPIELGDRGLVEMMMMIMVMMMVITMNDKIL